MPTERDLVIARFASLLEAHGRIRVRRTSAWTETVPDRFGLVGPSYYEHPEETNIDIGDLQTWATRVELALDDLGGPVASVRTRWATLGDPGTWGPERFARSRAIVDAVLIELREGRIVEPLAARVRAKTESELILLARDLVEEGGDWIAMAMVVAGTALELRLRRIAVGRLTKSIDKLTLGLLFGELKGARPGTPTIDPSDDDVIARWVRMRNDAAHRFTAFPFSAEQTRAELAGIEAFLQRAPIEA